MTVEGDSGSGWILTGVTVHPECPPARLPYVNLVCGTFRRRLLLAMHQNVAEMQLNGSLEYAKVALALPLFKIAALRQRFVSVRSPPAESCCVLI